MSRLRAYFTLDPRSLAAFRVGLGLVLLYHFLDRARELEAHYTDFGVLPRAALSTLSARPIYSLHMLGGSGAYQAALLAVSALAAVFLTVGLFTRAACVLAYVLLFSVQQRNPVLVHGQDAFMLTLLTWALFLPLGAAWSLDARRQRRPTAPSALSAGSVGLALQPWILYAVVTVSKLQYPAWTEGRAVYALLHKAHYVRPLGALALQIPGFTAFATYATLACEIAILVLLTSPWRIERARTSAFALNTAFHGVLFCMVDVGLFQPLAILSVVPLLPGSAWNRFAWTAASTPPALATPTPRTPVAWLGEGLCVAIIIASLVSVPPSFLVEPVRYPEPLASIYYHFRLERRYRMFANMDATPQGWWGMVGTLEDGRTVDAVAGPRHVHPLRPNSEPPRQPTDEWQSYLSQLATPQLRAMRPYLAEYFCRRWNRDARAGQRMTAIEMLQMKQDATHPDRPITRKRSTLLRGPCP